AALAADFTLSMPSISPFAPGVTGSVDARGRVEQTAGGYSVKLDSNGPERASGTVAGTIAPDFRTLDLNARGTVPLGIVNRFMAPNTVAATASFDISVKGPPALQSVSGTASVAGATLSLPTLQQTLNDIGVQVRMSGDQIRIDASGEGQAGGTLSIDGTLQLGNLNADLQARLDRFVLTDPLLYRSTLDGGVTLRGPLAGAANIAGQINIGSTEIRVPDGGLGFGGSIPDIRHVNEPGDVFLTRKRAGLVEDKPKSGGTPGQRGRRGYGLDVTINAPSQIFIRGRGLDAEMGGTFHVRGTTSDPQPVGQIDVIRGRLDILGRRLDLNQGSVSLAGGLVPWLDLNASSSRDDFVFNVSITGPVDDPEFELSSVPNLPQDEVLAHFLFGKGMNDLSPFQAVQLASAVATLTGRASGPGLLGGLRQGLGLDDLDVATGADGDTEVRAGKYLADNIYTEVVVGGDGGTVINLNIDLSRSLTVRGSTDSTGDSGIGIYFERDY
ncbi:translocation/assembly module TamB domain-containing protein, partial [Tropicimonas sp.]|uniref:translocation/assembly module TamB domain-containing protein n=1 Tax=Tropicimonas sp. TaxID=2067044 RepID=UPI003A87A0FD